MNVEDVTKIAPLQKLMVIARVFMPVWIVALNPCNH